MTKQTDHNETPLAREHHEETLYAEPVFYAGPLPITNSLINSWIALVVIAVLALVINKKIRKIPGRFQGFFEVIMEKFFDLFDSITHSRKKSMMIAPIALSFFFFILVNNWLGILPGVGSITWSGSGHGPFPLFRGGTADLNTTLALAIIGVAASHFFGVFTVGVWRHFNKFLNLETFLEIPKKIRKDPSVIMVNPIKAFVGLVEIIGEVAKVASFSFRLFGNVFAGEVLLAAMVKIMPLALPIPFMMMEIVVGLIQALIFMILVFVYININTSEQEH